MRIAAPLVRLGKSVNGFFWRSLHRAAPDHIRHPAVSSFYRRLPDYQSSSRGFYRGHKKDEVIHLRAVFAVDFFTPSTLDAAISRLRALGWDKPRGTQESIIKWLRDCRSINSSGSWANLGIISRNRPTFLSRHFHSTSKSFPSYFSEAMGQIHAISPSLSAIVFCFVVPDDRTLVYQEVINEHHFPEVRPAKDYPSLMLLHPTEIKRERLFRLRARLRKEIKIWFRSNIGGVFSTSENDMPCVEFAEVPTLLAEEMSGFWVSIIGHRRWYAWKDNEGDESFLVGHSQQRAMPEGFSSYLMRRGSVPEEDLKFYGTGNLGVVTRANFSLGPLTALWGTSELTKLFEAQLADMRDGPWLPITARRSNSLSRLNRRWRMAVDTKSVCAEMANSDFILERAEAPRMTFDAPHQEGQAILSDWLMSRIKETAAELLSRIDLLLSVQRDLDSAFALIQTSKTNRTMSRLAAMSVLLAIVALLIATISGALSWSLATDEQQQTAIDRLTQLMQ